MASSGQRWISCCHTRRPTLTFSPWRGYGLADLSGKSQEQPSYRPKRLCPGDFDSCASRAYFAVLQAEIAALIKLTEFRQEQWRHDRVQEEFNRRLIQARKVFPASLRSIHNDIIGRRRLADYTDQHTSVRTAEGCLRKATEMVTTNVIYVEVGYKTDEETFLVGDHMAEIGADILEETGVLVVLAPFVAAEARQS